MALTVFFLLARSEKYTPPLNDVFFAKIFLFYYV